MTPGLLQGSVRSDDPDCLRAGGPMSPKYRRKLHPLKDSRAPSPGTTLIIAVSLSNCPGLLGNLHSPERMSRHQGGKPCLSVMMRKTVLVQAEETLEVAALRLKQKNIGALPVVEADHVVGIITDRDILMRGPAERRSMTRTKAREVMSVGAVACNDKDDLDYALGLMSRKIYSPTPCFGRQ